MMDTGVFNKLLFWDMVICYCGIISVVFIPLQVIDFKYMLLSSYFKFSENTYINSKIVDMHNIISCVKWIVYVFINTNLVVYDIMTMFFNLSFFIRTSP